MGAPFCVIHKNSNTVILTGSARLYGKDVQEIVNKIIELGWDIKETEWRNLDWSDMDYKGNVFLGRNVIRAKL